MKLYESYCYNDISDVSYIIASTPVFANKLVDTVTHDSTTISINFVDLSIYQFIPPSCSSLGFSSSYSGLTQSDAIDAGWLVSSILLVAFGLKILKRTL